MDELSTTREMTLAERQLIRWMLERGQPQAQQFLPQFEQARVTSWRCRCGCASIYFSWRVSPFLPGGVHSLADFIFGRETDLCGIFVFSQGGVLSGVEVYGMGCHAPPTLPKPEMLRPFPDATPHA